MVLHLPTSFRRMNLLDYHGLEQLFQYQILDFSLGEEPNFTLLFIQFISHKSAGSVAFTT
jgi:hypothetical protein